MVGAAPERTDDLLAGNSTKMRADRQHGGKQSACHAPRLAPDDLAYPGGTRLSRNRAFWLGPQASSAESQK